MLKNKKIVNIDDEELPQSLTRMKISGLILLYFSVAHFLFDKYTLFPIFMTIAHFTYSSINYSIASKSKKISHKRIILSLCVDLGVIAYIIHEMDKDGIILYPVIIWIVVANGIRFGEKHLLVATAIAETFFLTALLTNDHWDSHRELLYSLSLGLIVLSVLFLHMIKRLHHLNETLEVKVAQRVAEIEYGYLHDSLTDLKNREALTEDLKKSPFSGLMVVDIDGFRNYNDLYGMKAGNQVLKCVAKFLQTFAYEKSYEVYRIYGDHFVLRELSESISLSKFESDLEDLFKKIETFKIHLEEYNDELEIEMTAGISLEKELALKKAEMALSYAQKEKKDYFAYSKAIDTSKEKKELLFWKNEIKKALYKDNVIPLFQPIVDRDENVVKYESLMRLRRVVKNEEEMVSPFFFLEIAHKSKQYEKLTLVMIEKSFRFMKETGREVSINLSFEDITNKTITTALREKLQKCKIGRQVIFEIVESSNINDFALVKEFISQFRKLGVRFSIDDFGSGYSNFTHIFELAPDYLKIDGSLVKNIDTDLKSYLLVKSIVQMAKELSIKTVAEFVSKKEIFDICYKIGVDYFQGFYFSEPVSSDKIKESLSKELVFVA